ncbi:MAG: hypothetical protein A2Y24_04465 [Clostridiales bacterium GWE2_32_10]|nr:MAG: hypothetical protein A2Y24_04465 [Clostridiales bacterium GWE2_32_10]
MIGEIDLKELNSLMNGSFNPYISESHIVKFEDKLAKFFKTKHAIAVSSGTAAIHCALAALDIGKGDEVLVPSASLIMSVLPVLYQNATPIFVDCKKNGIDFDYEDLERKISPRVKVIIPVYLWGCSYDMDKLMKFASKHKIDIVEDACQAHGTKWGGKYLGTYGRLGCFSLKDGKLLSTGEGGFLLTDDSDIADRCRLLRNHCINTLNPESSFSEVGWNYRITEFQGLIGNTKIESLDKIIARRQHQTKYLYERLVSNEHIDIYEYFSNEDPNYFSALIFIKDGKKGIEVAKELNRYKIINSTGTFGLIPIYERNSIIKYLSNLQIKFDFNKKSNCHTLFQNIVAISVMDDFTDEKLDEIADRIEIILNEGK